MVLLLLRLWSVPPAFRERDHLSRQRDVGCADRRVGSFEGGPSRLVILQLQ